MLFYQPNINLRAFVDNVSGDDEAAALDFEGLDYDFDVLLQRRSKPNQATIIVYNLSEVSRNLLTEEGKGIELFAGYGANENRRLIFRGTIANALHEYQAPNWVTTIYSGDGQKSFDDTLFSKSYSFGTPVKQIIRDCANTMGLPLEFETDKVDFQDILYGESYSAKTSRVLDRITKDYGLEWSVQFGILEIREAGKPRAKDSTAVKLAGNTGLLETPIVTDKGIEAISLLNHEIRPGRLIEIDAKVSTVQYKNVLRKKVPVTSANGIYIADQVRHTGNNYGGRFVTEVEARRQK